MKYLVLRQFWYGADEPKRHASTQGSRFPLGRWSPRPATKRNMPSRRGAIAVKRIPCFGYPVLGAMPHARVSMPVTASVSSPIAYPTPSTMAWMICLLKEFVPQDSLSRFRWQSIHHEKRGPSLHWGRLGRSTIRDHSQHTSLRTTPRHCSTYRTAPRDWAFFV